MKSVRRAEMLDEIRGFAIICMVVYHTMFDLNYFLGVNVPVFFDVKFDIVRDIFAGAFIFISGCVCRYSRDNLKRGVQCFFLGAVITYVTAFAVPDAPVRFGILHMLGISMLIFGLSETFFDKIPVFLGIPLFVFLFFATYHVPEGYVGPGGRLLWKIPRAVYNAKLLFPLGFDGSDFSSADYFPLMPWLFLFIAGSYFGVIVAGNALPRRFYTAKFRFFAAAGRNSIWIYLLHQPVLFFIFTLVSKTLG